MRYVGTKDPNVRQEDTKSRTLIRNGGLAWRRDVLTAMSRCRKALCHMDGPSVNTYKSIAVSYTTSVTCAATSCGHDVT